MHRSTMGAALMALGLAVATAAAATPLGTAFTYQGRLESNATPVNGSYAFIFRLFDSASGGLQVGTDQPVPAATVSNGLFTVTLDFGAPPFTGQARWLDIQVKGPGDATYTALTPRAPLTAAPYALYALTSGTPSGSQWTNDANGIDYSASVGIGMPSVTGQRLRIDGGTTTNPLVVTNNNTNFATLALGNSASNGLGLYDATSGRHYLTGKLGIGTLSPTTQLHVIGSLGQAVRGEATGSTLSNGYSAAMIALGYTGTGVTGGPAMGVYAASDDWRGVWGISSRNLGVVGDNVTAANSGWLGGITEGVFGQATTTASYGGRFTNTASGGVALRVDGLGQVKSLQILGGADLAERFDTPAGVEPGTVMAIDPAAPGRLEVANGAYSRTVAGVVSGANGLAAGVELSKDEKREGTAPIALTGRVWVKCDATGHAIHAGDLLTTADRAGYAMCAGDRRRAPGAILGKAMTSLERGTGLVLVLVSLQ